MTRQKDVTKRHCMVVYSRYPWAETRVQREAEALAKHGYLVDVICPRAPGDAAVDSYRGVRIYREVLRFPMHIATGGELVAKFLSYIHFFILATIRLARLHHRHPYTTIQVHNLPDFLVFCALIPKLTRVPVILDLHDLMPEFYAGRFGQARNSWLLWLIRWQERLACKFADHVITVSEHWRQALIQRGVPPHKCSVVMNVADQDIFHRAEDSHPHRRDDTQFRLIYHGTIVYRYGLDLVIRAIHQVRHDIPNIHLTILGKGDYMDTLIQMVHELDLNNHVTIHGIRPAEELPAIIQTAHLGIVAYRNDVFTDGLLPTKLMEYATLGLPAIAARTTAIEAYFKDTMIEFFEPGDVDDLARHIRGLFHSPERLVELAQGCQKFNQRYNWANISAEYVALVYQLGTG